MAQLVLVLLLVVGAVARAAPDCDTSLNALHGVHLVFSDAMTEEAEANLDRFVEKVDDVTESQTAASSTYHLKAGGGWTPPFWECEGSRWIAGYSRDEHVGAFVELEVAICNQSVVFLASGHSCEKKSAKCSSVQGENLTCSCLPGYVAPEEPSGGVTLLRSELEEVLQGPSNLTFLRCVPCAEAGAACGGDRARLIRAAVLGVQAMCMAATATLAAIVFRQRKCKTIAAGMWTILETILLGIFLLYATVVVRFLEPSVTQCLLEPWTRELGFVICYGSILLKLYRILIEFRTRKAHRWVVRDKDLLKYLLGMVVVALGYMAAWTASTLNFLQDGHEVVVSGVSPQGMPFLACRALWWDYVTETGEMLIVLFGLHLGFASRNAASQFGERRFLCLALGAELAGSGAFYVIRAASWRSLPPDLFLLATFARSQLTNTATLLLVFTPKLWYEQRHSKAGRAQCLAQDLSAKVPLDAFKPQDGNAPDAADVAEINLADMNPEDIRAELKRLYTQLEVLKNKTIRADNPHISKRRGGRKVAHRRFSLQKKGSREKALHHRQQTQATSQQQASSHGHGHQQRGPSRSQDATETELSRTPEDSVCSNEGPSAVYNDLEAACRP